MYGSIGGSGSSSTSSSNANSMVAVMVGEGVGVVGVEDAVKLDQVPRWGDADYTSAGSSPYGSIGAATTAAPSFADPLTSLSLSRNGGGGKNAGKFPLDFEINSKIYLWRGQPWNLEVDAVVNSTTEDCSAGACERNWSAYSLIHTKIRNRLSTAQLERLVFCRANLRLFRNFSSLAGPKQNLDEAHSSPGLHSAAGPGLAEECAMLGGCRTGLAKATNAYDLPARKVIHTVGPRYAVKYHTAAENALSHCYRSCLELLIEEGLSSIAMGCIYTEGKGYPREPAAHVAIRTVRRFMEKHKDKIAAIVFCTSTASDTEIYKRLLPLYFPRNKSEEDFARSKLPVDVGDENGETNISERKIRITALPAVNSFSNLASAIKDERRLAFPSTALSRSQSAVDPVVDPAFMSMIKDPDQRRKEQWEKVAQAQAGWRWARWLGMGNLGGPPLSVAQEDSLHARYLARANAVSLTEIMEMKILYRGGVDIEGRPVMVVVGAHFLLRCLDLERFVLYTVKEFEPLIQKPYTIVYFHSAAALQLQPDLGWMKRLQQILGRKHQRNLHSIYVLHPTLGLKATILGLQLFVEPEVWRKVVYVERLLQLFRYVPREQLTIPDFVFQHDLEVNGGRGLIADPQIRRITYRAIPGPR